MLSAQCGITKKKEKKTCTSLSASETIDALQHRECDDERKLLSIVKNSALNSTPIRGINHVVNPAAAATGENCAGILRQRATRG
jgi:hypothetical protein